MEKTRRIRIQQFLHLKKALRLAVRGGVGEIVEVQGGHIVRSTGCKDNHNKVCTAKGPRDRQVRLFTHTTIGFSAATFPLPKSIPLSSTFSISLRPPRHHSVHPLVVVVVVGRI
ncbi:hypothetical protein QN277_008913 [Acacia crassicarpa]|uniref:TCP domain-containing protein n=1 Tax=Acacia crassicarpa TaxID=499986 RepID=A0AAE1IRZ8_9FABA|nr:hypothetical protein QN277_008913 [Acacia crassicarpa]